MSDENETGEGTEEPREASELAGRGVDPLDALLAISVTPAQITETVDVPILHKRDGSPTPVIPWTLKVLDDDEVDDIRERATKTVKVGRNRERQTDFKKMHRLLVAAATTAPDLRDPKLLGKYGSGEPHNLIPKLLLPGTITKLADKVMELGGYDDDELVEAGKD